MALAISNFVNVAIAIAVKAAAKKGFGTLVFTTPNVNDKISVLERYRIYDSMEAVTADFSSGEVYEAATAYYSQNPTPNDFIVVGVFGDSAPASLVGGTAASLSALKAITAGGFSIEINGVVTEIKDISLAAAVDLADVATIINNALGSAANCTYVNDGFVIKTTVASSAATLSYAHDDVQALAYSLGLMSTNGGLLTQGNTAEKPVNALSTLLKCLMMAMGLP